MRHSDELDAIFRKYWGQMSDQTRHLARETVQTARRNDSAAESRNLFHEERIETFDDNDSLQASE